MNTTYIKHLAWHPLVAALALVAGAFWIAAPAQAEGESVVLVATQKAGDRGPIDGLIDGLEQPRRSSASRPVPGGARSGNL